MNKTMIAVGIASLFSFNALAGDSVRLEENFKIDANSTIHFDIPVGSLDLRTHNSDEVIINVRVKAQEDGWFSSDADLDDAYLEKDISGSKVRLEIDLDDTVQEWEVTIPASANIDIDLGVGEIDLEDVEKDIFVDVGVGEVDIELASDDYDRIELESGVGATDLSGFRGEDSERNLVSESTYWRGNGRYQINVEVGVGEVDVRR